MSLRRLLYRGFRALSVWHHIIEQRFTPVGRFALGAGFAAGVVGVDTRMNLLHQAFALAVALLVVAAASAAYDQFRLRQRFEISRELPRYATVGIPFEYRVRLSAAGIRLLRGCSVEEQLPDPRPSLDTFLHAQLPDDERINPVDRALGYPRWRRLILVGSWAEKVVPVPLAVPFEQGISTLRLHLRPLRRGYLRLSGGRISRPDPLGLVRTNVRVPCEQSLLILPRRYPVPRLDLTGHRQYHQRGMALASAVGDSQEFIGLREYRNGDSLRNIHWASWARSGTPYVKEYQDEFFTRHALILDTFAAEAFDPRFEAAVSVAASLSHAMQNGDTLLDLMFVGVDSYCFTGGRGLAGAEQFLEVLACAQPCHGQPFARLEQSVIRHAPRLSAAVCVLLNFDQERRDMILNLRAVGLPLKLLVIAEESEMDRLVAGWNYEIPILIRTEHLADDLARL